VKFNAKFIGCTVIAVGTAVLSLPAKAEWPDKPIKMIVPYAAGSGVDVVTRPIAIAMGKALGQSVMIDNKPSAGGIVGTQALASAAPDGYTFGFGNLVTLAINKSFFTKLPYNPEKDLQPVGGTFSNPYVLIARNNFPANNFKELIEYVRKNPGKVSFGTPGVGSAAHLAGETINTRNGLQLLHVPYKSGMQGVTDMVGGQLDLTIDNIAGVLPFIKDGRVKAIAVTSLKRLSSLPDVVTMHESGMNNFEVVAWGGFVAPTGTPKTIIDKLNSALHMALRDPVVVKLGQDFNMEIKLSSPEEFGELARAETQRWAAAVKAAGVHGD
jgi:tripartite-type tricarboxylate transporter receptor subunit TctC